MYKARSHQIEHQTPVRVDGTGAGQLLSGRSVVGQIAKNLELIRLIMEGTNHFSLLDYAMSEDYELNKIVIEFIQNQQRLK